MDFSLTQQQKQFKEMCRRFAQEVVAPRAEEFERTGEHPYDIVSQMADLGMMGIPFPKKYGGQDGDWVSMFICLEELSRVDMLPTVILSVTVTGMGQSLYQFGTEEQKKKWLIPIAQGKELGAMALTEPDSGSDSGSLRTTARLDGNEWVINGSKQFITNTGVENNSILIVAAKTVRESDGKEVICTILVPTDSPGFKVGQKTEKMGMRATQNHELFFDDCRVPKENLLGGIDKEFSHHLTSLQGGRIAVGAMTTGFAQACFNQAVSLARKKYKSTRSIMESEVIPFSLSDMAVRIEIMRNLYLKAAWLKDHGKPHVFEAACSKLYCSETSTKIAGEVFKMYSPEGVLEKNPIARFYRQAKLSEIVDGTSEMQRLIIAREILSKEIG